MRRDGPARVGRRAEPGHALLLDCRTLEITPVPIPDAVGRARDPQRPRTAARRQRVRERRAACEAAAARLGVATLRDATIEQVADDPIARHVVTENARVEAFARALERGDLVTGRRADAREPSVAARRLRGVDPRARSARRAQRRRRARSARGSPAPASAGASSRSSRAATLDAVAAAVTDRYRAETGREPNAFAVSAVDGAGLVDAP